MRAKYCVWTVDDKVIKEAKELVERYGDNVITKNEPVILTIKFLYQMLNLSTKDKSNAFRQYRAANPQEFYPEAYDPELRKVMVKYLAIPKLYELAVGQKGEELVECTFYVNDIRAVEQIERMISKANAIAIQAGKREIAYSDYEVPPMRRSVHCTPLAKLRRIAYNWD